METHRELTSALAMYVACSVSACDALFVRPFEFNWKTGLGPFP
jgi:hypothetical protein